MKKMLIVLTAVLLLASCGTANQAPATNSGADTASATVNMQEWDRLQAEYDALEKEYEATTDESKKREIMQKMIDNMSAQAPYYKAAKESGATATQKEQPKSNSGAAYTLSAGDYEISADVAEGKYDVVCVGGMGVFNLRDPQDGYVISETMDMSKEYGITERKNTTLKSGQSINITGTLTVELVSKD